mgnify:CR=1 FL=1
MQEIKNIKIEKAVYNGYGLAHANNKTILIENVLPADIVDVRIYKDKKKVRFAKPTKFRRKSRHHIPIKCNSFGKCGGCNWLNAKYESQLEFKQCITAEIFNKIDPQKIENIQASPEIYNYRNKSFLPVSEKLSEPIFGMFAKETHSVITHEHCYLHPNIFEEIALNVLNYIKSEKIDIYDEKSHKGNLRHIGFRISANKKELLLILVTKNKKLPRIKEFTKLIRAKFPIIKGIIQNINKAKTNKILGNKEKIHYGKPFFKETINEKVYKINYKSFLQINTKLTEKLYDYVLSNIESGTRLIDAFSGIGTIGISLADKCKKIIFIEYSSKACADTVENCKFNQIPDEKYLIMNGKVENKINEAIRHQPETIIFDPPRKGIDKKTLESVMNKAIPKIIYISCNPMTQARDIKILQTKYNLEKIKPFDMFPQTYHIENVAILKLK